MTMPDPMATGSGISGTADGSAKIRRAAVRSESPTPGDISAALYGLAPIVRDRYGEPVEPDTPIRVAPYTTEPALTPARHRWRAAFLSMADRSGEDVIAGLLLAADTIRRRRDARPCIPDACRGAAARLEAAVRAEVERGRGRR